ncbi:hypothetical protein SALBM311S_09385 [Streptomyces alboniger]
MNVDAFLKQAEEYEAGGDLRDSVLKILNVLPRSHPFTTVRAAELKKWSESRDFQRPTDRHYPRRSEDRDTSVTDSFRESAASYATNVKGSKDPLMKLVSDIAGGAGDLGGRVRRGFGGFASSAPKDPSADQPPSDQPPTDTPPRDDVSVRPHGPTCDHQATRPHSPSAPHLPPYGPP